MIKIEKKILAIENDEDTAKFYKTLLGSRGYVVETAYDGEEGLKKIKEYNPNAFLLDLMLPELSGWDVLEGMTNGNRSKVIVVTVKNQPEDMARAQQYRVAGYIVKPFENKVLLKEIEAVIANSNKI